MSRTAIRTGVISIVLVLVTVGVFGTLVHKVLVSQSELTKHVGILAKHRAQQSTFFELRRTAEETTAERAELESLFFTRVSDSVDFLNLVEGLAPQLDVVAEAINLTELVDKDTNNQWLTMTFEVTGGETAVEDFIEILERLPYALRLTDIEIEERSSTLTAATVVLQVRLLQYDA